MTSAILIGALSLAELLAGVCKVPVSVGISARSRFKHSFFLLPLFALEFGLCAAVNVLEIISARSYSGDGSEWKLLIAAAVIDFLLLLQEASVGSLVALRLEDELKRQRAGTDLVTDGAECGEASKRAALIAAADRLHLPTIAAYMIVGLFVAPLAAHWFRTTDRKLLVFSSETERRQVLGAVFLGGTYIIPLFFYCCFSRHFHKGHRSWDKFGKVGFFLRCAYCVFPLLVFPGLALHGAYTRTSRMLLASLLALMPPFASYAIVIFNAFGVHSRHWEKMTHPHCRDREMEEQAQSELSEVSTARIAEWLE